jgi:hypothetical protein
VTGHVLPRPGDETGWYDGPPKSLQDRVRELGTSREPILPNTTHITLMQRMPVIVPMVNDVLDAKPQKQ